MINKKYSRLFLFTFISVFVAALIKAEQFILAGIIGGIFVVLSFGADKIKLKWGNKTLEIEDEHKD